METTITNGLVVDKNKVTYKYNGYKKMNTTSITLRDNVTTLDFSNRGITIVEDHVTIPLTLTSLDLSHNKLVEVPYAVLQLVHLKTLNLSNNLIQYFDNTPSFCNTLENLDLSNNKLKGPPYWAWTENPNNLINLNLSNNPDLTKSFHDGYFEELLQYVCPAKNVSIYNCGLNKNIGLLSTFINAKSIIVGKFDFSYKSSNLLTDVPSEGLHKCCSVVKLSLTNVQVYTVNSNINIFKSLVEIDLSQNKIRDLPEEFCDLDKLEICILSYNYLLYLPDNIEKLKNLICLQIDNNELCMLPDSITNLTNLKNLDLYNNGLFEVSDILLNNIEEIDTAQNYLDEPDTESYILKKEKLRLNRNNRADGRKHESTDSDSIDCRDTSEEELLKSTESEDICVKPDTERPSSPEDWDSDEYWVPHSNQSSTAMKMSSWIYFVQRKMAEGCFCPMDAHTASISEQVKYKKMSDPVVIYESDGQFDDYSEDDS